MHRQERTLIGLHSVSLEASRRNDAEELANFYTVGGVPEVSCVTAPKCFSESQLQRSATELSTSSVSQELNMPLGLISNLVITSSKSHHRSEMPVHLVSSSHSRHALVLNLYAQQIYFWLNWHGVIFLVLARSTVSGPHFPAPSKILRCAKA